MPRINCAPGTRRNQRSKKQRKETTRTNNKRNKSVGHRVPHYLSTLPDYGYLSRLVAMPLFRPPKSLNTKTNTNRNQKPSSFISVRPSANVPVKAVKSSVFKVTLHNSRLRRLTSEKLIWLLFNCTQLSTSLPKGGRKPLQNTTSIKLQRA